MSMLSAQIDELRERAKVLRQGRWSDGADNARLMEDAADTIWQLRDDLQRTHGLLGEADREESRAWDRVCKAEAEADRLRKSLERAAGIIADICGECPVSRYEWLSSDGCAEKCGTVTEEECWIAYLTGKRWDESGVEVVE